MAAFQQQQYATSFQSVPGHPVFLQSHIVPRPTSKYLNVTGHAPVAGQVCTGVEFMCTLTSSWHSVPLHSTGQSTEGNQLVVEIRPSYGDCLEVKREYYQNCSVLDCVTQCSQSTAQLYEQFLQVKQIGFVTFGPLCCA